MGFLDDDSDCTDTSVSSLGDPDLDDGINKQDKATKPTKKQERLSVATGALEDRLAAIRMLKKEMGYKEKKDEKEDEKQSDNNPAGDGKHKKLQRHKSLCVKQRPDPDRLLLQRTMSFNTKLGANGKKSARGAPSIQEGDIPNEEVTIRDMMSKIREKHRQSLTANQTGSSRKVTGFAGSSDLSVGACSTSNSSTEGGDNGGGGEKGETTVCEVDEFLRLRQKREEKRTKLKKRASQRSLRSLTEKKAVTTTAS